MRPGESLASTSATAPTAPYGLAPPRGGAAPFCRRSGRGFLGLAASWSSACNTATAAAIDFLREKYAPMPIVGMEPAVKPACLATRSGVVGVLATERSLDGELFRRTAARYGDGVDLVTAPGRGFVELVENDLEATPEAEAAVRVRRRGRCWRGAPTRSCSGCTHYPFLTPVMERIVDGRAAIVDPSPAVARRVGSFWTATACALRRITPRAHVPHLRRRAFYRLRLERKVAAL